MQAEMSSALFRSMRRIEGCDVAGMLLTTAVIVAAGQQKRLGQAGWKA
jgi:hypothetical protein